jgi:hypothetical protein
LRLIRANPGAGSSSGFALPPHSHIITIEKHQLLLCWAAAGYAWDNSLKTEKNIGNNIG